MTFEQVLAWCRANGADVRGVYRGKDISIAHTDERLPGSLPSIGEIFTGTSKSATCIMQPARRTWKEW